MTEEYESIVLVDGLNDLVTSDLHHFQPLLQKSRQHTNCSNKAFIMVPLNLSVWLELEVPLPTLYKKLSKTVISNHHLSIKPDFFLALWSD